MSEEKCFCHLNGYKVKDADARADIKYINTIITNSFAEVAKIEGAHAEKIGAIEENISNDILPQIENNRLMGVSNEETCEHLIERVETLEEDVPALNDRVQALEDNSISGGGGGGGTKWYLHAFLMDLVYIVSKHSQRYTKDQLANILDVGESNVSNDVILKINRVYPYAEIIYTYRTEAYKGAVVYYSNGSFREIELDFEDESHFNETQYTVTEL